MAIKLAMTNIAKNPLESNSIKLFTLAPKTFRILISLILLSVVNTAYSQ